MSLFVANVLLALAWALSFGGFTPANFLIGLVLGYIGLRITSVRGRRSGYFRKVWVCTGFALFFIKELIVANLKMAVYTLSPLSRLKPGILAIPLTIEPGELTDAAGAPVDEPSPMTDLEITSLANIVTLTPGTLSVDISRDRKALFVHFMHVADREAAVREIEVGFKRRLLEMTR